MGNYTNEEVVTKNSLKESHSLLKKPPCGRNIQESKIAKLKSQVAA